MQNGDYMNLSELEKANILVQALPYIQRYYGKTIVVKYGGSAMLSDDLKEAVINDIVLLSCVGINVVLVHGGGPEITGMLNRIGKKSHFINGMRYTDNETIDIVQMVLAGKTCKDLVSRIEQIGGHAVGLCGIDGGLIKAKKFEDGQNDYGNVGEITDIDPTLILNTTAEGYIPVISTVAAGIDGNKVYNINADTAASKIAVAIGASNLLLITDVRGLLRDPHDDSTLIPEVSIDEIDGLISDGIIKGGMIPKVNCCVDAVRNGIARTCIIDGRIKHSLLLEILSDEGIGTMFIKK